MEPFDTPLFDGEFIDVELAVSLRGNVSAAEFVAKKVLDNYFSWSENFFIKGEEDIMGSQ